MNEKILWTLREHAMKIIDFKNKKMKFEKIYGKVRNHCHFTDEYRGGFFFLHIQFTPFQTKMLQSQGTCIFECTWDPSQKAITK